MRAYVGFSNCENKIVVDCITLQSKIKDDEVLDLSFSEQDYSNDDGKSEIRLKDEEEATFGLPNSLVGYYGNNEATYNFVKNAELCSVVVYDTEEKDIIKLPKLDYLEICIGEKTVTFNKKQLANCSVEF